MQTRALTLARARDSAQAAGMGKGPRTVNNQRELWIEFARTRDTTLRERLILQYIPLVKYVIGRVALALPGTIDSDDLLQFGTIGLIKALDRYDPSIGTKFETFAIPRIRGSIIDELRSQDVIPRSTRQRMREITAAQETLLRAIGRDPTFPEIAESTGMTERRVVEVINLTSMIATSLDRPMEVDTNGESITLVEVVEDPRSPNPVASSERRELESDVADAIDELQERERLILALYYQEDLTMKEIAAVLSISESRVCQLHARAVLKLRTTMGADSHVKASA